MKMKTVGVIVAMQMEMEKLLAALTEKSSETVGGIAFHSGKIGETRVILCVCGIGKVFAAMCAEAMILRYSPDEILNSGVAGALSEKLSVLSVAVAQDFVQHDMDTSPLGDPVGMISGIGLVHLPCDKSILKSLTAICERSGQEFLCGTVASGDCFVALPEEKARLGERFGAIACEMEGGAIAQVCFVNHIPFGALRAISDSISGAGEMEYSAFAPLAAERSAALILSYLQK